MFLLSTMSNSTSISEEASASSETRVQDHLSLSPLLAPLASPHHQPQQPPPKIKKKRSQPGNPDPDAEVVALSPKTLMATNRFICEICNKGFQRDQNLQLHRRGHNLPWKLRQKSSSSKEGAIRKRVYVCPEPSCVHHHPSRALGDLTGIKKHFSRKHGEKKWKCDKCSKRYAVHSDWKAYVKTCGTREYRCDCGTLFSRKDTFITHRAFCDALAEESARLMTTTATTTTTSPGPPLLLHQPHQPADLFLPFSSSTWVDEPLCITTTPNPNFILNPTLDCNLNGALIQAKSEDNCILPSSLFHQQLPTTTSSSTSSSAHLSATALLQRASAMGPISFTNTITGLGHTTTTTTTTTGAMAASRYFNAVVHDLPMWQSGGSGGDRLTRDFLGVAGDDDDLLLLDLDVAAAATSSSCAAPMAGQLGAGFPPATRTWN